MTELLPCPFCGSSSVDPEGWMSCEPDGSDKRTGPACDDCGASAESDERWNTRDWVPEVPQSEVQIGVFPYQQTFDAISAAVSLWPCKEAASGISISVRKFQEAFNSHRDAGTFDQSLGAAQARQVPLTLDWLEAFALEIKPFGYVKDNAAIDDFLKAVRARTTLAVPSAHQSAPSDSSSLPSATTDFLGAGTGDNAAPYGNSPREIQKRAMKARTSAISSTTLGGARE